MNGGLYRGRRHQGEKQQLLFKRLRGRDLPRLEFQNPFQNCTHVFGHKLLGNSVDIFTSEKEFLILAAPRNRHPFKKQSLRQVSYLHTIAIVSPRLSPKFSQRSVITHQQQTNAHKLTTEI